MTGAGGRLVILIGGMSIVFCGFTTYITATIIKAMTITPARRSHRCDVDGGASSCAYAIAVGAVFLVGVTWYPFSCLWLLYQDCVIGASHD